MPTINLTANGRDQELILAYLTENASNVLADKINKGVLFEKDGKQLINRKDLDGFMKYACGEARKLAEKGSDSACVEDSIVYGWAIHYFEEDGIQGKLFNSDGTEYKPPAPVKKTTTTTKPTPKPEPPKPKTQFSFFDMLNEKKDEQKTKISEQTDDHEVVDSAEKDPSVEEIADALQKAVDEKHTEKASPTPQSKPKNELYEKYGEYVSRYPGSVIAMRVGDFYEILGKNAVALADELNMTLTSRDLGLEQRIPMIGFPYHAADVYFKILRQKHSVVVVETDGERKLDEFGIEDVIDGDDEMSEEEMRLFDGDISEPKEVIDTPSSEQAKVACKPTDDSPYDEIALAKVVKLLGDTFILR